MEKKMRGAAENLEFEEAARLRDEIKKLQDRELGIGGPNSGRPQGRSRKGKAGTPHVLGGRSRN
jgi:excinuclease ABC subunit B